MINSNRFKLILAMGIAFFILMLIILFVKNSQRLNRNSDKIEKRLVIPSEFLGGKTLSLGDDFEIVEKIEELKPYRVSDGFLGRPRYSYENYSGVDFKYFLEAKFNVNNELYEAAIKVYKKENVSDSEFFVKTVKTLTKYYGENYQVYGYPQSDGDIVTILRWQISKKTKVEYICSVLDSSYAFQVYDPSHSLNYIEYNEFYNISDTIGRSTINEILKKDIMKNKSNL